MISWPEEYLWDLVRTKQLILAPFLTMKKETENNRNFSVKTGKNCPNRQSNSLIKEGGAALKWDTPRHHQLVPQRAPTDFQRFGQALEPIGEAVARSFSGLSARSGCQDGKDEEDAARKARRKPRGGAKNTSIEETYFDQPD